MTPLARSLESYTRARRSESRIERFIHLWIAVESSLHYAKLPDDGCKQGQRRRIDAFVASMPGLSEDGRAMLTGRLRDAWSVRNAFLHKGKDYITPELLADLQVDAYRVVGHAFGYAT